MNAAVAALTIGITGQIPLKKEVPLSNSDILIVRQDVSPAIGQADDKAQKSAEMGKAEGVQNGGGPRRGPENSVGEDEWLGARQG